jgi:hypothetical protein
MTTVRCRPGPTGWLLLLLSGSIGVLPLLSDGFGSRPMPEAERVVIRILAGAVLLLALVAAGWIAASEVQADERGLRWRGLSGRGFAVWHDVTDYYEALPAADRRAQGNTLVIETGAGSLRLREAFWEGTDGLRQALRERASNARTTAWLLHGTRAVDDWPRTFVYRRDGNFWIGGASAAGLVGLGLYLIGTTGLKGWRLAAELGWAYGLALGGLGALVGTTVAALGLAAGASTREELRRRDECIEVDPAQITFRQDGRAVRVPWSDVRAFYQTHLPGWAALPARYVVETRSGAFDFTTGISDVWLLKEIVKRNATSARAREWGCRGDELATETARYADAPAHGADRRVYHYRNRTNRALLWLSGGFAAMSALSAALYASGMREGEGLIPSLIVSASLAALTAWFAWRYYRAGVLTDDRGITQHTPFGKRRLGWDEVETYLREGSEPLRFGRLRGRAGEIRFWTGIEGLEDLEAEITRHLENVASPGRRCC